MRSVRFVLAAALLGCASCPARQSSLDEPNRTGRPAWAGIACTITANPSFALHGFKAGVRPHSYWPVAVHLWVDRAKLDDVKAQQEKIRGIVDAALSGAEKEDILSSEKNETLKRKIQNEANQLFEGNPVLNVGLWLDVK